MNDGVIIPITYIEQKPNSSQYRIVGKGITVTFLATLLTDSDWPVDRICDEYGLTPAEVHAAWAFYYDHQAEIDAYITSLPNVDLSEDKSTKRKRVIENYQLQTGKSYPDSED